MSPGQSHAAEPVAASRAAHGASSPLTRTVAHSPAADDETVQAKERARPVRVLFLNHTAKLGGGELALEALLRHLSPNTIDAQLILFEDGPLRKRLEPVLPVSVVPLSAAVREARKDSLAAGALRQAILVPAYLWKLRRAIRQANVDYVHANSLKADILGGLAARWAGRPVIWHVRDRIESDYLPAKVVSIFRKLARIVPAALIANSHATMQTLHLNGARPSRVIHDGLDLSSVPASSKPPALGTQVFENTTQPLSVGLVGRISPWKGQHIFLEAISLIKDDFPSARFQIIGSALFGESEYEAKVRRMCRDFGLENTVTFTGFVEDVPARIAALDLVVHASTLSEPFGQVVIEGMAAGKPVIATNGGGVPEIIVDGVSGMLVPMSDAAALAGAMRQMLSDPARRAAMGAAGRERVREAFQIQEVAAKLSSFYQDLRNAAPSRQSMQASVPDTSGLSVPHAVQAAGPEK